MDVDLAEAAGWLDKAARKRTLAAGKQQNTPLHPQTPAATISVAGVQQLLDVLSGVVGMPAADMAAVLRKWPRYLACEPAQPRGTARFLRVELGLTAKQAATSLRTWPQLLGMEAGVLRQRRDTLQCSLVLSEAQLATAIRRLPMLLAHSVSGIQQQAAGLLVWFYARGWTADGVAKLVSKEPRILNSQLSTLQTNFARFMDMCSLSQEQTVAICCSQPTVLVRNMARLSSRRKLDFLQQVIGRPVSDLAENPAYLSRSLENVIAPRTYFMRARGKQLSPSLHEMQLTWARFYKACGCTEAEFKEWVAAWRQTPEGRQWGSEAAAAPPAARQRWERSGEHSSGGSGGRAAAAAPAGAAPQ